MPASAVLSPVAVTSMRSAPAPLIVPAMTLAPTLFSTGRDSPVIIDSLISLCPSRTTPSAGTLSPGRTSSRSPSRSAAAGTSSVAPLDMTRVAMSGSSLASSFKAPCAWPIERISNQCPSSMIVTSDASSSHSGMPGKPNVTATLNPNATVMASEISVIMPGVRSRSSRAAPCRNTQPPYRKTSDPNTAGMTPLPWKAGA